jgi:hypothetical protein
MSPSEILDPALHALFTRSTKSPIGNVSRSLMAGASFKNGKLDLVFLASEILEISGPIILKPKLAMLDADVGRMGEKVAVR